MSLLMRLLNSLMRKLQHILHSFRNFPFNVLNREFLIFLFFLLLSGAFWTVTAMNDTYEQELSIPLHISGVPKNVILTDVPDDTVRFTVRDKGFIIATYLYGNKYKSLYVDFSSHADKNKGNGSISLSEIQKMIYQHLYSSSRITSLKADKLTFHYNYGQNKKVPVVLSGGAFPGKSYYIAKVRFIPQNVTVYADSRKLDSIKNILTQHTYIYNVEDTIVRYVSLKKTEGVKTVPSKVKIIIYPDVMIEESMEVPVTALNMPMGKVLRTFPSRVSVKFTIGASQFRHVHPDMFKVVADYNEIQARPSDKCSLHIRVLPKSVNKASLDISKIDYLIEQQ